MRKYEHDTSYYGYDILRAIRKVITQSPSLDRNGIFIWVVSKKDDLFPLIVYLNLDENDYRGSLEFHKNGKFISQINSNGILYLNNDKSDCIFDEQKLISYLEFNLYNGLIGNN